MKIWNNPLTLEQINEMSKNTMVEHLDIQMTEIGEDYLKASMPVCHKTTQPMGLLHGGASVALAETLGSIAALMAGPKGMNSVGLEVNANHVRSVRSGMVHATASPIHVGRSTQVWEIRVLDDKGRLISIARLTVAVIETKV